MSRSAVSLSRPTEVRPPQPAPVRSQRRRRRTAARLPSGSPRSSRSATPSRSRSVNSRRRRRRAWRGPPTAPAATRSPGRSTAHGSSSTHSTPATGAARQVSCSISATRSPTRGMISRPGRSCGSSWATSRTTIWRSTTRGCPSSSSARWSSPALTSQSSSSSTINPTASATTPSTSSAGSTPPTSSMTAPGYLAAGALLRGRYEIVREIGRGGSSGVYLARDRELDSEVAVKLLVPPPAAAHVARERMRREVQAVRGLSHANIVAVFDFLEDGPWSFIVMEYVRGPDLQVRVAERGRLDGDAVARIGRDVATALAAAHRRGILHRDVKPQNILLEPDGRARLTDFGSAKLDGQLGVTASGTLAGTLAYTAPEVLAGRRGDARADVYALGLTLYFALTGELPERSSGPLPPASSADGY